MLCDRSGTRYVISQGKFKSMTAQVSPMSEQTAIAAVLSDMDAELAALEEWLAKTRATLVPEFGRGFEEKNLRRMVQFAEVFPDAEIVATLRRQLGWSHFKEIIPLKNELQRDFYADMCRMERWSVRILRQKIGGMFFERSALSKKPDQIIRQELDALQAEDRFTPDLVLQDPYLLDFLGRRIRTARRICSRRCCARSSASCWSAGRASPLSSGRSEPRSTATTTTWTCSSITTGGGGWS